jgi:hypothetical protein
MDIKGCDIVYFSTWLKYFGIKCVLHLHRSEVGLFQRWKGTVSFDNLSIFENIFLHRVILRSK